MTKLQEKSVICGYFVAHLDIGIIVEFNTTDALPPQAFHKVYQTQNTTFEHDSLHVGAVERWVFHFHILGTSLGSADSCLVPRVAAQTNKVLKWIVDQVVSSGAVVRIDHVKVLHLNVQNVEHRMIKAEQWAAQQFVVEN